MPIIADIQSFIDQSRRVTTANDLDSLMQDITREMGFDHYALVHHVDLKPFDPNLSHMASGELVALSNYPENWIEEFIANDTVRIDPIMLASMRTNVGFRWDEVDRLITLTADQKDIIERARYAGIYNGFTVPAHVPGEANGSCNFALGSNRLLPLNNLPMAQLVGSFAFQAARSLVQTLQADKSEHYSPARLTSRQLECVALVAKGKSDWEIGCILGTSEETVKKHLKDARAL